MRRFARRERSIGEYGRNEKQGLLCYVHDSPICMAFIFIPAIVLSLTPSWPPLPHLVFLSPLRLTFHQPLFNELAKSYV
jgi:hypothetical protein